MKITTTKLPHSRFWRFTWPDAAVIVVAALLASTVPCANAGTPVDFNKNAALTTATNYSSSALPTNTTDVRLTTTSTPLAITSASLVMESLSAVNGTTYTISNGTTTATSRTLTLGNSAGFTNVYSTATNDLVYLTGNSNLTIQGPNSSTGTGLLNLTLASSGNFDVDTGSTLNISSVIAGSGFGITKSGAGAATLGGASTFGGGMSIVGGSLTLASTGVLGTGNVTLANGTTLTLATGVTNGIADTATLTLGATSVLALNGTAGTSQETVNGLIVSGVPLAAGTYGGLGDTSANFQLANITGNGELTVLTLAAVPEPSTWAMMILGSLFCAVKLRSRRRSA